MLLVHVVDQLAAHARVDHAVREWNRVVAVPVAALVAPAVWSRPDVDPHKRRLELRLSRLRKQAQVVLRNLRQSRNLGCAMQGHWLDSRGGGVRIMVPFDETFDEKFRSCLLVNNKNE